jgi:outer membrane protein assembly factor BamB
MAWVALTGLALFPTASSAQELQDLQCRDGLIVFLGMPNGQVLASVQQEWNGLVQVLIEPADERTEVNMRLEAVGIDLSRDGRTTLLERYGPGLPYRDNSVNCIVQVEAARVSPAELMRVLVPRGTLVTADGKVQTKPLPEEIDEWTHALHDATNNAVADDTAVGPPKRLQWIGAPDHGRHHNFLASVSAMVSARGRLFTVVDEGPLVSAFLPPDWTLSARDAFNGITLWERKLDDWGPVLRNFRSGPAELGRRLVAVGGEVYVTLGFEAPISVLDAATGEKKTVLPGTEGTEEIVLSDGVVLAVTGSPKAELRDWASDQRDFTSGVKHNRGLVAVSAATHELIWQRHDRQSATLLPMTLAAKDGRVFLVNGQGVAGFDIKTGEQLWHTAEPVTMRRQAKFAPTVVVHGDVLLYADRLSAPNAAEDFYNERPKKYQQRYRDLKAYPSRLRAYDVASGERLWDCDAGESFHTPTDILVVDNTVWYTASPAMLEGNFKEGRDLRTGEVVKRINGPDINHGRCYRNKATSRYLLGGKNGLDFIDPDSSDSRIVPRGFRGTCQLGVLPCNGLVYLPPHACTCEATRKVNGFLAVSPGASRPYPDPSQQGPRFRPGPAYGQVPRTVERPGEDEWPTFRHDPARTGCASTTLPEKLDLLWERRIGRRPTAPVCAGGRLYVAAREDHLLWALDAASGEPCWQYRTAGRIDSPPTIDSGLVVFGSRDGWLRCLRAEDGELVWRFRGAAEERQIVVREQLESVWPLHGTTLVTDGKVYFAAGRASVLDGGIMVFCLDLFSGKVLARARFRDDGLAAGKGANGQDALLDVLSFVDGRVTMRSRCLTPELEVADPVDHLQSATGLLDDNFFHRSYWAYAKGVVRYTTGTRAASGYLVTLDGETAYAYGRGREYYIGHIKGFERHLYAASIAPKQMELAPGPSKPRMHNDFGRVIAKYAPKGITMKWSTQCPVLVKGMTIAAEKLVVAGPAFELHPSSYLVDTATDEIRLDWAPDKAALARRQIDLADRGLKEKESPRLCVVDKETGEVEVNAPLASSPVFDGLIAATGCLYLCREDGVVSCLGGETETP